MKDEITQWFFELEGREAKAVMNLLWGMDDGARGREGYGRLVELRALLDHRYHAAKRLRLDRKRHQELLQLLTSVIDRVRKGTWRSRPR